MVKRKERIGFEFQRFARALSRCEQLPLWVSGLPLTLEKRLGHFTSVQLTVMAVRANAFRAGGRTEMRPETELSWAYAR
jgi:hypothetical protein